MTVNNAAVADELKREEEVDPHGEAYSYWPDDSRSAGTWRAANAGEGHVVAPHRTGQRGVRCCLATHALWVERLALARMPLARCLGDTRAAVTPFLAHKHFGDHGYKWMLYGHADTLFYMPGGRGSGGGGGGAHGGQRAGKGAVSGPLNPKSLSCGLPGARTATGRPRLRRLRAACCSCSIPCCCLPAFAPTTSSNTVSIPPSHIQSTAPPGLPHSCVHTGVQRLLQHLDPQQPWLISDNLLWRGGHDSRAAARCLPCSFDPSSITVVS